MEEYFFLFDLFNFRNSNCLFKSHANNFPHFGVKEYIKFGNSFNRTVISNNGYVNANLYTMSMGSS